MSIEMPRSQARGTFSFLKENTLTFRISDDLIIKMERVDPKLAALWFVDEHQVRIPTQITTTIFDTTNGVFLRPRSNGEFMINSEFSYEVRLDAIPRARLHNQRQSAWMAVGVPVVRPVADVHPEVVLIDEIVDLMVPLDVNEEGQDGEAGEETPEEIQ